ncbi:Lanosterol synthase (Oxidosqualene--lanosterol cyclase) [Allomyces arbusculus]|nr:Lanosterol synthase (Oxidosqualene--lanosterol cyclase) [Allomyces arbusculus]
MTTPKSRVLRTTHLPPVPEMPADAHTDRSKWFLCVDDGRQWWEYRPDAKEPQSDIDRFWLGQLAEDNGALPDPQTVTGAVRNSMHFLTRLQTDSGHWAGEYGGPMFLIPGLVIAWYVTGRSETLLPRAYRIELVQYLRHREVQPNGGWGIHIESPATVFGTALNYVALRILGVPAHDPVCERARKVLHALGGATGIPSWGKFWLSVMNCYNWDGLNPIPPELWLLPYAANPIHPGRMWVHTRMVYLPMSYIYARRLSAEAHDPLVQALRSELYVEPFDSIKWSAQKFNVCAVDRYVPQSSFGKLAWTVIGMYEAVHSTWLRDWAVDHVRQLCFNEDDNTEFLDLGPVNKALNIIVTYHACGADSDRFRAHERTVADFMWMSDDGMRMNGTNGSQLWDTAFIVQAATEAQIVTEYPETSARALAFLDACQIKRNAPFETYRQQAKGAWPFSNRQQSYTVSDCTAEGLKATLMLQNALGSKRVSDRRVQDSVDVLLSMPNRDGGFASYEIIRGPSWLEALNPAEVFGKIMIEYSYPECTTSSVLGLMAYTKYINDGYRTKEVARAIHRAVKFILKDQRKDGSWYGAWGVCFTYAGWFAVESLVAATGATYATSDALRRACAFLVAHQREDGGWGESYKACEVGEWVEHPQGSQVVNTAWALLALLRAGYPDEAVIRKGIDLLLRRQLSNGSYRQEGIEGVFNKNCMISYPNYKLYFPMWALARYANTYKDPKVVEDVVRGRRVA